MVPVGHGARGRQRESSTLPLWSFANYTNTVLLIPPWPPFRATHSFLGASPHLESTFNSQCQIEECHTLGCFDFPNQHILFSLNFCFFPGYSSILLDDLLPTHSAMPFDGWQCIHVSASHLSPIQLADNRKYCKSFAYNRMTVGHDPKTDEMATVVVVMANEFVLPPSAAQNQCHQVYL